MYRGRSLAIASWGADALPQPLGIRVLLSDDEARGEAFRLRNGRGDEQLSPIRQCIKLLDYGRRVRQETIFQAEIVCLSWREHHVISWGCSFHFFHFFLGRGFARSPAQRAAMPTDRHPGFPVLQNRFFPLLSCSALSATGVSIHDDDAISPLLARGAASKHVLSWSLTSSCLMRELQSHTAKDEKGISHAAVRLTVLRLDIRSLALCQLSVGHALHRDPVQHDTKPYTGQWWQLTACQPRCVTSRSVGRDRPLTRCSRRSAL
ncbi:hypothetical protein Micbo1qcDRAFT_179727 [Microdochium bolleyi]|uniref:Uncharacterized protein n=1 Tax=Microdochium bolleyi TaxID=196109 RepID=A0A136IPC0_9PEZI|nr:hypothetical protein Micbo1qcDRAFT_179727 [Microdochium bolleyi]